VRGGGGRGWHLEEGVWGAELTVGGEWGGEGVERGRWFGR